jgi:hypothetical protein
MPTIKIDTRTPAFDRDSRRETAQILRVLADAIEGAALPRVNPLGS